MTQFEYLVVASDQAEKRGHVEDTFNQYGAEGWELVETSKKFFIFIREVPIIPTYAVPDVMNPDAYFEHLPDSDG